MNTPELIQWLDHESVKAARRAYTISELGMDPAAFAEQAERLKECREKLDALYARANLVPETVTRG